MDFTQLEQIENVLFYVTFGAYLVASVLYIAYLINKSEPVGKGATVVTVIGFIANSAALVIRTIVSGHAPFANGYEFLMSFSWGIVIAYLFAEFKYKLKVIGSFTLPVAWLLLAYVMMIMPADQRAPGDLFPALQSNWLTFHVVTAMFSYGAFAVSFGIGVMYLIKENLEKSNSKGLLNERLPKAEMLDELSYRFVAFGFPLLSLVIITGAIWAEFAWGRYWSWDPKETWSLITWLVYAAYLHARFTYGWKGRRAALMAVIGFVAVLFTFFGVNYFLPGLHSYALIF
ncbi:cytochrome c-type biogenesis protein CcsB [Thermincola ferriacetica]|uniref:Heme exporter protein C n=1 Tax=Thermincola ferriacetica TaxID=281456 RepID=A0A0L6W7D5_9FIRM|nr:c-type cytochrome biogenesis protein CcsB [Thermincola ferriacetica]KNZ71014.1 cytochrome c-type biogenesis protein CcsB [Thermincola ferriacetica]